MDMTTIPASDIPTIIFDRQATLKLAQYKPEIVTQLLTLLLKSLDTVSEHAHQAYAQKDIESLRIQVHKLHGGLCYISAPQLLYLTQKLEKACIAHHQELIAQLFDPFCEAIDTLQATLNKEIGD